MEIKFHTTTGGLTFHYFNIWTDEGKSKDILSAVGVESVGIFKDNKGRYLVHFDSQYTIDTVMNNIKDILLKGEK